jgi:tetraacyldisaccharide 4'-kinase
VHLLDDGFQHRQLHRDIDILLLNRQDWQDTLLPAGNLREPRHAASRATVIAIPADDPHFESDLKAWGWQDPIWRLHRKMETPLVTAPVVVFCGIARPNQFFGGLETPGLRMAFPDHHRYSAADLQRLATLAGNLGATALVTTEKDQIRLGKLVSALPQSLPLTTVRLRVEIENQTEVMEWLMARAVSTP